MKNKILKNFLFLIILNISVSCKEKSFDFLKIKDDENLKKIKKNKLPFLPFLNNEGDLGVQKENPGIKKNLNNLVDKNDRNNFSDNNFSNNDDYDDFNFDDFDFDDFF